MKTQKRLKRITALLMCAVLLATSLPIALAAGTNYDPVPVFDAQAREIGASAWFTERGDVAVRFPQATANGKTWKGDADKTITDYIVEFYDLGSVFAVHTNTLVYTQTVSASMALSIDPDEEGRINITLPAEQVGTLDSTHRFGVNIIAKDSENWVSSPLSTVVSDTPQFVYDAEAYKPLTTDAHALREMITFETDTNTTKQADYLKSGDASLYVWGRKEQTGAENTSGVDTTAMGFRIDGTPTGTQSFDTTLSRQTWDFSGAEEVWFWMDLRQVELKGLSFRLRANEKQIRGNDRIEISTLNQKYGDTVYSTLGTQHNTYAPGEEPYVLVQQTDGSWEKVLLNNGTIDLGHFKGYVRVPLQYICAETDSVVHASNLEYDKLSRNNYAGAGINGNKNTQQNANKYVDEVLRLQPTSVVEGKVVGKAVTVNTAGTPVADSLLIQNRSFGQNGAYGAYYTYDDIGAMLAVAIEENDAKTANHPRRAYLESDGNGNYTVMNRGDGTDKNGGYKAIEDIFSAGFAYNGVGADSVNNSFFLDNIMFYRTDGEEYSSNTLDGAPNTGDKVDKYFNQQDSDRNNILNAIDDYISMSNWSNFNEVKYIEDMIAGFKKAYDDAGQDSSFLDDDQMASYAAAHDKADIWKSFTDARDECKAEGTYGKSNSEATDLLPQISRLLEKAPNPDKTLSIDDEYLPDVIKLYQAYSRLNKLQLNALGKAEEEKLVKLLNMAREKLADNSMAVGQKLADYPFIPFNDFEQNTEVGQRVAQLENDTNFSSTSDYRHTKGLLTYTTSNAVNDVTYSEKGIGSKLTSYSITGRIDGAHADITENGYNGSKGLTLTVDSNFGSGTDSSNAYGVWMTGTSHVVTMTRNSQSAANFSEYKLNNMRDTELGQFSSVPMNDDQFGAGEHMLLSLVMYVDFSELTAEAGFNSGNKFSFSAAIYTQDGSGNDIKAVCSTGSFQTGFPYYAKDYWHTFYYLDDSGNWQRSFADASFMFGSESSLDAGVNLYGYKGYIAIPLRHFKWGTTAGSESYNKQLNTAGADYLNNIYAIQFILNGNEKLDGKSVTIDNVGFTYDPAYYADGSKTGNATASATIAARTDQSYAERYNVISIPARDFCASVDAIDVYDDVTRDAAIAAARSEFNALPPYQQGLPAVVNAEAQLKIYETTTPEAPIILPDDLKAFIGTLPEAAKNASIAGENDLPNPGFVKDGNGVASVNYAAYGLTQELAQQIIDNFEKGYMRYSPSQKSMILPTTETLPFVKAYYAAKRCKVTLDENLNQANEFNTLFTADANYAQIKMPVDYVPEATAQPVKNAKISDRDKFVAAYEKTAAGADTTSYLDANYYTKYAINKGDIGKAGAGVGLITWLQNTMPDTGVPTLVTEWTALYTNVKGKIDNRQLLTAEDISNINAAVNYYHNLSDAYRNTYELTDIINKILKLFPVDAAAIDKTEITLSDDTPSDTANYQVTYSEQLPVPKTDAECNYITVTSKNRGLKIADLVYGYNVTLSTPDGTTVTKKASDLALPLKIADVIENNQFTADSPWNLAITPAIDSNADYPVGLLTDTLIIEYYTADGAKLEDLTKEVVINYQAADAYTVTIPAEFPITWGTEETDVSYSVDCALQQGSVVSVKVSGSNKLTAEQDSAYTMDYASQNFGSAEFKGVLNGKKPDLLPAVVISRDIWKTKPTAVYKDTLTYTVEYTSAP